MRHRLAGLLSSYRPASTYLRQRTPFSTKPGVPRTSLLYVRITLPLLTPMPCRLVCVGDVSHIVKPAVCTAFRHLSSAPAWTARRCFATATSDSPITHGKDDSRLIDIGGKQFHTDEWLNAPPSILSQVLKRLHVQKNHPISITRQLIESRFPGYKYHNEFFPVVTTGQNFDSLGFPAEHPGRSRTDTYYINKDTVLRTHTSAHQDDVFRANQSEGFLISADVYRRDAVDRTHSPIFHQMEGARMWDRSKLGGNVAETVWRDVEKIRKHGITIENPNPIVHPERNPLQQEHTMEEVEAIATHLKRSLEDVVVEIFSKVREAAVAAGDASVDAEEPLRVRWVEAYFPFTSPSWELEVFWQGDWLEVCGCGVVLQKLLHNAGVPDQLGWAFGMGLDRIAMLMFNIPDIRLFWSQDPRFLSQFADGAAIRRFEPFSKFPECYKDVSFWVRSGTSSAGGGLRPSAQDFHENDVMEIIRSNAGNLVEDVRLVDEFVHPRTQRKSMCYRINYRSLERTLTNEEVNNLHEIICADMVQKLGVEIR